MAKDVDLSSREWTDLVFQGKNKEFGAYTLRNDSPRRHTKAILYVLGVLAVIIVLLILKLSGAFDPAEDELDAQQDMTAVDVGTGEDLTEDEPEDVQEIEDIPEPEPEEVQEEEEVTATQALTELVMVDEVEKDKEQKDPDEILQDTKVLGSQNIEGVEDLNKKAAIEEVVEKKPEPVVEKKDEGPVSMAMVEQKPMFPGGDQAMYKWIGDNLNYPAQASEEGAQGKVTVSFVVEKDGSITNVKVVRGRHPALDQEATRVIKKMPKWTPGRNNGVPVRVTYMLPVTFKLN